MASIKKKTSKISGLTTWSVIFRKRKYKKDRVVKKDISYCASFGSQEQALKFIDDYEHIFYLEKPGDIEYDGLMERRKRRFSHKLKDKT